MLIEIVLQRRRRWWWWWRFPPFLLKFPDPSLGLLILRRIRLRLTLMLFEGCRSGSLLARNCRSGVGGGRRDVGVVGIRTTRRPLLLGHDEDGELMVVRMMLVVMPRRELLNQGVSVGRGWEHHKDREGGGRRAQRNQKGSLMWKGSSPKCERKEFEQVARRWEYESRQTHDTERQPTRAHTLLMREFAGRRS